jgi:hypothetical protein
MAYELSTMVRATRFFGAARETLLRTGDWREFITGSPRSERGAVHAPFVARLQAALLQNGQVA